MIKGSADIYGMLALWQALFRGLRVYSSFESSQLYEVEVVAVPIL